MNKIEYIKSKINDRDIHKLKQEIRELIKEDEEILYEDGNALLEYLVSKDLLLPSSLKFIRKIEIINALIKYGMYYNIYFLDKSLIEKLIIKQDGKYLLEDYMQNERGLGVLVSLVDDANVLLEICKKYNDYSMLEHVNKNVLMTKYADKTFLEYLLNELKIVPCTLDPLPNDKEFIKFLYEKKLWDYLKRAGEVFLVYEVKPNKTLFEALLDEGIEPVVDTVFTKELIRLLYKTGRLDLGGNFNDEILLMPIKELLGENKEGTFLEYLLDHNHKLVFDMNSNDEMMNILFKKERFDYLSKFDTNSLLKSVDGICYFDYLLDLVKEGKLKEIPSEPLNLKAEPHIQYYFKIANHQMMEYIKFDKSILLKMYEGKTLLEEMINEDKEFALNYVLDENLKATPEIAVILNSMGIIPRRVDMAPSKQNFDKEYIEKENKKLGIGPLPEDGELLLRKLEGLFKNDGKSAEDIVDALIQGYRNALVINYETSLWEIKRLIDIKETHQRTFYYLKSEDGSYFRHLDGSIYCADLNVEILLHETGHALHYYLADFKTPSEYESLIKTAQSDINFQKRVFAYSKEYTNLKKRVEQKVEEEVNSEFIKPNIKNEEISIRRDIVRDKLTKIGIPDNIITENIDLVCTEEAFFEHQKRIWVKEKESSIIRNEFGGYMSIGDILDAIYEGKVYSQVLVNKDGNIIDGVAGHGINYYYGTRHGFDEMIANFASILKSKDYLDNLVLLKEIIGEDLYNMISNFYFKEILGYEKNIERGGR